MRFPHLIVEHKLNTEYDVIVSALSLLLDRFKKRISYSHRSVYGAGQV